MRTVAALFANVFNEPVEVVGKVEFGIAECVRIFTCAYDEAFIFKIFGSMPPDRGNCLFAAFAPDVYAVDIRVRRQAEKEGAENKKGTRGEREYRKCF